MGGNKNNGAVFMKLFFVPALFLAGLFIFINPVHAEANWQNTFEYYNFDTYSSSTWADSGLNKFNIIDYNAVLVLGAGKFNNAQYFNLNQNYTYSFDGPENKHVIENNGYVSVSFWYKLNEDLKDSPYNYNNRPGGNGPLYKSIWSQDWCTNNSDWVQVIFGDTQDNGGFNVQFLYNAGYYLNNFRLISSQLPTDQSWHNIVIVWKNNDPAATGNGIWIDGVKDINAQSNGLLGYPLNTKNMDNGCYSYLGPYNLFDIAIDDLAVVKSDITPAQIALLQTESYGDMLGAKPAQAPILSGLGQFKSDGTTAIGEGGGTAGKIIIQGTPTSPSGNQVQLQVEIKSADSAFNGTPTASSTLTASGQAASITVANLSVGQYHWQARTVDSQGNYSAWQTISNPSSAADFLILRAPVVVIPGILGSQEVSGQWVMDPILHSYDNLWLALKLAGYAENKTLFSFPFDWRQSNISSMGGLVARAYAESSNYQNDINQLIFLATPQNGAPQAYLGWEGGSFGKDTTSMFINAMLSMQAKYYNYNSVFDYVRNFPIQSVREILPTYN